MNEQRRKCCAGVVMNVRYFYAHKVRFHVRMLTSLGSGLICEQRAFIQRGIDKLATLSGYA